jgi:hypothetical protein
MAALISDRLIMLSSAARAGFRALQWPKAVGLLGRK